MKMRAVFGIGIAVALSAVQAPALSAVEGQRPLPVGKLSIAPSTSLGEIDVDRMKGQPARLAWSPDGQELYLQLIDGEFGKGGAQRHVIYTLADGRQKSVDAEPAWANAYWMKKSDRRSPDDPSFQIALESVPRVVRTVSAPMGGDLARGGMGGGGDIGGSAGGTSAGDAIANAANAQSVMVHSMKLGKEIIGEFANMVIVPGLTFGWGPAGSRVIAYANVNDGELIVMDIAGKKQKVDDTEDVLLPAWSADGTKLAWVRRDSRKKFSLHVANVTPR